MFVTQSCKTAELRYTDRHVVWRKLKPYIYYMYPFYLRKINGFVRKAGKIPSAIVNYYLLHT